MHTWKKSHLCLRIERYLIFMLMSMKTSHSTNFVSIWRNSSKNLNENDLIWRNDNSFTLTMSLSRTEICRWLNIFRNCVLIWMTFKKKMNFDYHDSNHMREILIRTCRDHSILLIELHNSSSNVSSLINSFYINIINFESINKKKNIYLQSIDTDINECDHINCTHEHNFIDRQYRRESINYRDNRKFLIDSRSRDKFSIRFFKICFVCDKSNCWSINHSKKERENSKSALRIIIQNENHIQNFNVVWSNSLLKLKIIRKMISLLNFSKNWLLTSTSRSIISRSLISSLKKSTANRKLTSSLSTRSMTRKQSLQLSSCLLTRHLNTD
jgi:hypothetical protein